MMNSTGLDYLAAIASHSDGLAQAAARDLDAPVEHCPGWDVAALVEHVIDVHWFWATIARERLQEPPDEARRPGPPGRGDLLETMREGANRLVEVLREADQSSPVWTWAPTRHDVAFITRHQVQEAAVHHWDAAHAVGRDIEIEDPVAVDSIDEFLNFSVSSDDDPASPARPSLNGCLVLRSTSGPSWTVRDGNGAGTIGVTRGAAAGAASITASSGDLLLWLYGRKDLERGNVSGDLVERFRALSFTN